MEDTSPITEKGDPSDNADDFYDKDINKMEKIAGDDYDYQDGNDFYDEEQESNDDIDPASLMSSYPKASF